MHPQRQIGPTLIPALLERQRGLWNNQHNTVTSLDHGYLRGCAHVRGQVESKQLKMLACTIIGSLHTHIVVPLLATATCQIGAEC